MDVRVVQREDLEPGTFVDSDHPDVVAFAQQVTAGLGTDREPAVALFLAVRDGSATTPTS